MIDLNKERMRRGIRVLLLFVGLGISFAQLGLAQTEESKSISLSPNEYMREARKALNKQDYAAVYKVADECVALYGAEAKRQQASLSGLPSLEKVGLYEVLNDVGTCLFVKGEALVAEGKKDEAIAHFSLLMKDYSYAQAWDARGWYWSIAEKSQETLVKLKGEKTEEAVALRPKSALKRLHDPGTERIVNYPKYGVFENVGTQDYQYRVGDQAGLSRAVGEGIYPNTGSVLWDPRYRKLKEEGRLEGRHWDFIYTDDLEANFYKWATCSEPWGVRLFYTGLALERAGLYVQAVKAYYAIVVHFPQAIGWTYWHTPWYISQAAIAKIKHLCQKYPNLAMYLEGAKVRVINGYDNVLKNDEVITWPGRIIEDTPWRRFLRKIGPALRNPWQKIKKTVGRGKVRLIQYENGDWQLLVDNRPFIVKAVTYASTRVGESPDNGTLRNWMEYDYNHNGLCDGPYDSWVDKNRNNLQDKDELAVGDFQLMKEMGVNAIRVYHQPFGIKKELLRELYTRYGIRVIMGDFLGKYALGSGAEWDPGTDYENPQQRKNMLESVLNMVREFKDEPFILMWLLGNENVYGLACNADKKPDAFFSFANEVAAQIKAIDPNHPVAICNGDTLYLDIFTRHCSNIDIFGCNAYRGDYGFGALWQQVKDEADKPVMITEYGCPAYAQGKTTEEAEAMQAEYLVYCWLDIKDNSRGGSGAGNSVGGILFEWIDEWWKAYEPGMHDYKGLFNGPFPDGYMHEEWLGVTSQGDGKSSPFLRQLRKSYYAYQQLWRR